LIFEYASTLLRIRRLQLFRSASRRLSRVSATPPKFFRIPTITKAWGARYSGRAFLWVKQNADGLSANVHEAREVAWLKATELRGKRWLIFEGL